MCRLLGVVAAEAAELTDLLAAELEPFTDLAALHCDGWGLSYWDGSDDLVTRKAPEAALTSHAYRDAIAAARTAAAVLHLRMASANMPNAAVNTHPFVAGSLALAHDGYFSPLAPVEEMLRAAGGRACEGDTDSERYFGLVLANMRTAGPADALYQAAASIDAVAEVVALNALLLTHQGLYAIAYYDHKVIAAHDGDLASWPLRFRVGSDAVIVASNGLEQNTPGWEELPNHAVLEIRRNERRTTVHRFGR